MIKTLGHRNIKNALIYAEFVDFETEDEFICKAAKTADEAKQFIEMGFGYVCDIEDIRLFRKRK